MGRSRLCSIPRLEGLQRVCSDSSDSFGALLCLVEILVANDLSFLFRLLLARLGRQRFLLFYCWLLGHRSSFLFARVGDVEVEILGLGQYSPPFPLSNPRRDPYHVAFS